MPPATRVFTALAGVGVGALIFYVVLQVAGPRSTEEAADARFEVGRAGSLARPIARDGPLLFQDLLGGTRDVYVQHLGGDDWRAFEARAPQAGAGCVLEWRQPARQFADPCDGRVFPADGTGLTTFPTAVQAGTVYVDLRSAQAPATTAATTTTSAPAGPPVS